MHGKLWDQLKAFFPASLDAELALAGIIFLPIVTVSQPVPSTQQSGWRLVWQDEFNGTALDTTKWSPTYGNGGGGEEQQYTPTALSVADGKLTITARKQELAGRQYTSGVITTMNKHAWTYGLFEMKAKLPKGQGLWPAWWALTEDYRLRPTEFDIFEVLGHDTGTAIQVYHDTNVKIRGEAHADFTQWHVFAFQWEPDRLVWYVDGQETHRTPPGTRIPSAPMVMILNMAVGGNWPGSPDSSTVFPAEMLIDYVRVWSRE